MKARGRSHRPFWIITGALTVLALATACAGHTPVPAAVAKRTVSAQAASSPSGTSIAKKATATTGTTGTYQVSEQRLTFVEPAHTGPTGQHLTRRALVTDIRYPRVQQSAGPSR